MSIKSAFATFKSMSKEDRAKTARTLAISTASIATQTAITTTTACAAYAVSPAGIIGVVSTFGGLEIGNIYCREKQETINQMATDRIDACINASRPVYDLVDNGITKAHEKARDRKLRKEGIDISK